MRIDIRDVVSEEVQKQLQEPFAYATGFGVVFIDREGRHIGSGSNFRPLCQAINQTEKGRSCCFASNRHAIDLALRTGEASIYICHAGMVNIEIPIIIDGEFIGAVTAGQVFAEDPEAFPVDPVNGQLGWRDLEPFKSYYADIPTLSLEQIRGTAVALSNIANYIVNVYKSEKMNEALRESEQRLHESALQEQELRRQLAESRLEALQKQITPHFLYNVLNSVDRLIEMGQEKTARQMLKSFTRMFRYHYNHEARLHTVRDEIHYISDYLAIQGLRFGERLHYSLDIDDDLLTLEWPPFCLQTFVENALEHGLLSQPEGGSLKIQAQRQAQGCHFTIQDDGCGMSAEQIGKIRALCQERGPCKKPMTEERAGTDHYGIYNCYRRLLLTFGEDLSFDIRSDLGRGTTVSIAVGMSR